MLNFITNNHEPVTIGDFVVELVVSESHKFKNDTTSYPVENGFSISDHTRKHPERYTISGIISDTPIPSNLNKLTEYIKGVGTNRTQRALEELSSIAGYTISKQTNKITSLTPVVSEDGNVKPKIVDIVSGLRVYNNMICDEFSVSEDSKTGNALQFTMSFKRIFVTESKIVQLDNVSNINGKAPRVEDQAPKSKNVGKQTKQQPKSVLLKVFDSIKSKFSGN